MIKSLVKMKINNWKLLIENIYCDDSEILYYSVFLKFPF